VEGFQNVDQPRGGEIRHHAETNAPFDQLAVDPFARLVIEREELECEDFAVVRDEKQAVTNARPVGRERLKVRK
jgi:hypothetical protein